jgi:hypothetical protein
MYQTFLLQKSLHPWRPVRIESFLPLGGAVFLKFPTKGAQHVNQPFVV